MSGCHMSPWLDSNRRLQKNGAASRLGETFLASLWTSDYVHTREAARMPVWGVGLKSDQEGSQEETAVPRVYTSTEPLPSSLS